MIKQFLALLTCALCVLSSGAVGPTYQVSRECSYNSQCDHTKREVCRWIYTGCSKGQCMCDVNMRPDKDGHCRRVRQGGESCSSIDLCLSGMSCVDNVCVCNSRRMTPDRLYCLHDNDRLIGETCDEKVHRCLRRGVNGYTTTEANCIRSKCTCTKGFKQAGHSCRKWRVGEYGCINAFHCMGGALCFDGQCQCPNNYLHTSGDNKCVKRGAIIDLPLKATCDQLNERRYCAKGYTCAKCPGQQIPTCVIYQSSKEGPYMNGSSHSVSSPVLLATVVFLTVIYTSFNSLYGHTSSS